MVVTVSTFNETGAQLDEGVRHVKEEVVPSVRVAAGLKTGYWVIDREQGQRLSILVWESADAMSVRYAISDRGDHPSVGRARPQSAAAPTGQQPAV